MFATALPVRIGGLLERDGDVTVELGHDLELDRPVTVVALASDEAAARERFAGELRVAGRLEHAAIPAVTRSGTLDDGRIAYTLRRIAGRRLGELDPGGRLPVLARAVDAVAFAHELGIAHGSLDGSVIRSGERGDVVVERWGRRAGDLRADVRALGELLAAVAAPPPELASIVARTRGPYGSARELAADLTRLLEGGLVAGHTYTWPQRFARVIRRHRIASAIAGAAVAASIAIGAVSLVRIRRERDAARATGAEAKQLVDDLSTDLGRKLTAQQREDLARELRAAIERYRRDTAARTDDK